MEANPDIYGLASNALENPQALADSSHISNMIDWQRVRETLERKDGLARDVTIRVVTPILGSSLSPTFSPREHSTGLEGVGPTEPPQLFRQIFFRAPLVPD